MYGFFSFDLDGISEQVELGRTARLRILCLALLACPLQLKQLTPLRTMDDIAVKGNIGAEADDADSNNTGP